MEPGRDAAGVGQPAQHRAQQPRARSRSAPRIVPARTGAPPRGSTSRARRDVSRVRTRRSTGANGATGSVGEHPGVLAAAAALPRDDVAILAGDSRQPARHHAVVAAAVGEQEHAQHQRAALERARRARPARATAAGTPRTTYASGVVPRRSAHSRRASASRSDTNTGSIDASANAGLITPSARRRRASSSAAVSPHHQVAIAGVSSVSPNSRSQMRRQKREQRRRFEDAHAERVGDQHVSRRATPARGPGSPSVESARSSSGSQKSSSRRRRIAWTRPETGDRLQEDAIVAHGRGRRPRRAGSRAAARGRRARSRSRCTGPGVSTHDVRRAAARTARRRTAICRSSRKNGDSAWTRSARNASGSTREMMARFSSA